MTFRLYSIPVRCDNTRGQIWGDLSAILEGHAGVVDSEGWEINPFAVDVFKPKVAYLQNLSEIEKIACPNRFGPLRHALLNFRNPRWYWWRFSKLKKQVGRWVCKSTIYISGLTRTSRILRQIMGVECNNFFCDLKSCRHCTSKILMLNHTTHRHLFILVYLFY